MKQKTKIEKVPVKDIVRYDEVETTVYIADDGTEFMDIRSCEDYEKQCRVKEMYKDFYQNKGVIKATNGYWVDSDIRIDDWYWFPDKETFIKFAEIHVPQIGCGMFNRFSGYKSEYKEDDFPDWFGFYVSYDDNAIYDHLIIYSIAECKKGIKNLQLNLSNLEFILNSVLEERGK